MVGVSEAVLIASELNHTCVAGARADVRCWGMNSHGQVGRPPPTREYQAVAVPLGSSTVTALDVGSAMSCALDGAGEVWCWGLQPPGEDGTAVPARVPGLTEVETVRVGADHACAILADSTVACWGSNDDGQLGDGSLDGSGVPVAVTGLAGAVELALGHHHSCARLTDGDVMCWGDNGAGQLADPTVPVRRPLAARVPALHGVGTLAAAGSSTCAQVADGSWWCWGPTEAGRLAVPEDPPVLWRPTHIAALDGARSVTLAFQNGCALYGDELRCWGRGDTGGLGNGSDASSNTPVPVCW